MRRQISNSIYGLLDYAAYPLGMLALAPIILRHLGAAQYGVWAVTSAIVNFGAIVASGFGDANIQQVATRRGTGREDSLLHAVRASMGVHLVLGIMMALALWAVAPILADRLSLTDGTLRQACLSCIRIAGLLTVIRAVETVCISTQRAFERYGAAVRLSIAGRILSLAAAAALATFTRDVVNIMATAAVFAALALLAQLFQLRRLLDDQSLAPSFDPVATRELIRFGIFTWLLAAASVVFSQADRLIAGASMGVSAVVGYALCAQIAQPIYGITAAGLHFLFPYFANRRATTAPAALRKTLLLAFAVNVAMVGIGAGLLLLGSGKILHLLSNDAIARASAPLMPFVLAGTALLALSVTGTYTMLALGRARAVALLNLAGVLALVIVIASFLREFGVMAIVGARLAFALIALLVYVPLLHELRIGAFRFEGLATHEPVVEEA
jgi:O-antigen/teichoic acid export membrane protein